MDRAVERASGRALPPPLGGRTHPSPRSAERDPLRPFRRPSPPPADPPGSLSTKDPYEHPTIQRIEPQEDSRLAVPPAYALVHFVVIVGPSLSAFYYSLTDWSGVGAAKFVGLENYHRLFFVDLAFKKAFANNLLWLVIFLTVPFAISLGAASFS